jgi:hypothetical protein
MQISHVGFEGLIGKRSGSRYETGKRSGAWVKIKLHLDGYTEPEGARKYFGALLVGFYEGKRLKFAGRVGTGFSDKLLQACPFSVQDSSRTIWWTLVDGKYIKGHGNAVLRKIPVQLDGKRGNRTRKHGSGVPRNPARVHDHNDNSPNGPSIADLGA